jgi:ParB family chromosome partitioning protein
MVAETVQRAELVPVDQILVVNPRVRNRKVFDEIVENIAELGLKRPITVARRHQTDGPHYELVCGQGRLEAYRALGQETIPALVIDASSEDCLVMSLVENLARRQHRAIDLLRDIEGLKRRGYREAEIARKTQLSLKYVRGVVRLLENREHRLLRAVESGQIPVSVAVDIAEADDAAMQDVLQQAYESNLLRGAKLMAAKRLVEARQKRGKGHRTTDGNYKRPLSVESLLRTYQDDVDKKQILVRKAAAARGQIMFVTEALRKLLADGNFVTLLRAEGLETIPQNIAERLAATEEI